MYRAAICVGVALLSFGIAGRSSADDDRETCRRESTIAEGKGKAIVPCTRLIDRNPNDADAYFSRGTFYQIRGWDRKYMRGDRAGGNADLDQAIADFSSVIRLRPYDVRAYEERGDAYDSKNDEDRAIADFSEVIRLDPTDFMTYGRRAWAYREKHDYDRALADLDQAIRLNPTAIDYHSRGKTYEEKGDPDHAIADFDQALKLDPSYADARKDRERVQVLLAKRSNPDVQANAPDSTATVPVAATPLGRRIALVIGMGAYANVTPLRNPAGDARAVAAAFRRLGFAEVIEREDLTRAKLEEALKDFGDKAAEADWAVIYYAGHGVEMNGVNYLVPIDAQLARADHVEDETVTLTRLLSKAEPARKLRMVILDACRNNPFRMASTEGRPRTVGRGLSPIEPIGGVLVAYAARGGTIADDGGGEHSPFTQALLANLETPGLDIGLMFRKVRDQVLARTNNVQEPFTYGSLPGEEFYFKAAAR
jgi:tetratricopeptide (TPR) repeat protein